MVGKIIKLVFKTGVVIFGLYFLLPAINLSLIGSEHQNRINKRFSYPPEQELILNAINFVIDWDCEGPRTSPWYCDNAQFSISGVEASREEVFALGVGKPRSGGEFWWMGVKREAFWGEIIFEDEGETLLRCEEVSDIPADIFDGFFRYCFDGNERVDRSADSFLKDF